MELGPYLKLSEELMKFYLYKSLDFENNGRLPLATLLALHLMVNIHYSKFVSLIGRLTSRVLILVELESFKLIFYLFHTVQLWLTSYFTVMRS